MNSSNKMIYEPHIMPDPLVPFIFHTDTCVSGIASAYNWHTNIEILMCIEGEGNISCDGIEYFFSAGEIFVINSNMMHGTRSDSKLKYHCLILDRDFCSSHGIPTDTLRFKEKLKDEELNACFCEIEKAFSRKDDFRASAIQFAVLGFLIRLREKYLVRERTEDDTEQNVAEERIKCAMVFIRQNLKNKLSLEEIASFAGVSKYHFSREFKRRIGQTVFEYINITRCKEAKRLISEGMTVSEAAQTCGFENMSYFSRTYKEYMGLLPSETRN